MSAPAARVGDLTVTGDPILGPGVPTVLIGGQPAAVVPTPVSGTACVGATAPINAAVTVLIGNLPAARVGTVVTGANPASGVPVTTTVGPPGCPTVLLGP